MDAGVPESRPIWWEPFRHLRTWAAIVVFSLGNAFVFELAIPDVWKWVISAVLLTATMQVAFRWGSLWYAMAFFAMVLAAQAAIGIAGTWGFIAFEGAVLAVAIVFFVRQRRKAASR